MSERSERLRSQVSLSATGVVSAFGATRERLWRGLLSGESRVLPCELDQGSVRAAPVPDEALSRSRAGDDRALSLLHECALQIQESPAWPAIRSESLGVCVGTTQGPIQSWSFHQRSLRHEPTHRPPPPSLAGPVHDLARSLGAGGPVACPSMACASGTAAIGIGLEWIRSGACDAVVAGGVDVLSGLVHAGFACLKALDPVRPRPFDRDRAGLGIGEGAALVLLQRGLPDLAQEAPRVTGWAQSADAVHLTGPDATGSGLARAIGQALQEAGLRPEQVDFVSAHGTATVFNDLMEGKALRQVFGERVDRVPVNSIKGAIGHTMAAAGAIEAILCTSVLEHGLIPPTANLEHLDPEIPLNVVQGRALEAPVQRVVTTSSGFGGINAALVIER